MKPWAVPNKGNEGCWEGAPGGSVDGERRLTRGALRPAGDVALGVGQPGGSGSAAAEVWRVRRGTSGPLVRDFGNHPRRKPIRLPARSLPSPIPHPPVALLPPRPAGSKEGLQLAAGFVAKGGGAGGAPSPVAPTAGGFPIARGPALARIPSAGS